jgi:hypothetical protein
MKLVVGLEIRGCIFISIPPYSCAFWASQPETPDSIALKRIIAELDLLIPGEARNSRYAFRPFMIVPNTCLFPEAG